MFNLSTLSVVCHLYEATSDIKRTKTIQNDIKNTNKLKRVNVTFCRI